MDATTYSGTSATQNITNQAGFKPDLVWTKSRTNPASGYLNILSDSVRGQTSSYYNNLYSDASYAENVGGTVLPAVQGGITTLNSNGFTIANGSAPAYWQNESGYTYVGWQWQAGQGTNTTNTSGSITSTVSVNATAGFSVVTYTGNGSTGTIGHGLGVAPSFIIVKDRTQAVGWVIYQTTLGAGKFLEFTTATVYTDTRPWNNTSPTSTVFSVGNYNNTNNSSDAYVAYCWAQVAGFSAFGSYTGNGSTDGPFIYTGFRPKFFMVKCTNDAGQQWLMLDTSRSPYNVAQETLFPDSNGAEQSNPRLDFLSNGIKIRNTYGNQNTNGSNYVYFCFAENPFKYANAR
jgi:hypothetical protein